MCYAAEFGSNLRKTVYPSEKWPLASRLSRSLKIIGTDTDRSATYDFLSPINVPYSNVCVSRIVSEIIGNFSRESKNFPSVFDTTLKGFLGPSPWNWAPKHGVKNYSGGSTGQRKKFDDIFTHLDTINTNMTRRTPPTVKNRFLITHNAWSRAVKLHVKSIYTCRYLCHCWVIWEKHFVIFRVLHKNMDFLNLQSTF